MLHQPSSHMTPGPATCERVLQNGEAPRLTSIPIYALVGLPDPSRKVGSDSDHRMAPLLGLIFSTVPDRHLMQLRCATTTNLQLINKLYLMVCVSLWPLSTGAHCQVHAVRACNKGSCWRGIAPTATPPTLLLRRRLLYGWVHLCSKRSIPGSSSRGCMGSRQHGP